MDISDPNDRRRDSMKPILIRAHNPSAMTGLGNNTYLFRGGGTATLIDAGVGDSRHLSDIDAELDSGRFNLSNVVVTHAHADHASGAPAIASAHPAARFSKYPWPEEDHRYDVPWHQLADGDSVSIPGGEALEVIHTGGHSPDHVAFWHADSRSAFTGDLVVRGGSVMIHWSRGGDLRQYLAALERLLELGPTTMYPAHGPVITDPEDVLKAYIAHRRMRQEQVLGALAAGHSSVQAIADFIYDGLEPALMPAARENVRAHLEKLRAEGLARFQNNRWFM